MVSGRKEGENLGLNPFTVRIYYGDFNYMIINNNDPYSTLQNQPLSVFLVWSSYSDVGSALAPREKFHIWTYKLHFFTALIHPGIAPPAYKPGVSSLISESCQLCQPTLGLLSSTFVGQEQFSICPRGNAPKYLFLAGRQVVLVQHFHLLIWHCFFFERARSLFCPVLQAVTSVCLCLSQEDVSLKNQFL